MRGTGALTLRASWILIVVGLSLWTTGAGASVTKLDSPADAPLEGVAEADTVCMLVLEEVALYDLVDWQSVEIDKLEERLRIQEEPVCGDRFPWEWVGGALAVGFAVGVFAD